MFSQMHCWPGIREILPLHFCTLICTLSNYSINKGHYAETLYRLPERPDYGGFEEGSGCGKNAWHHRTRSQPEMVVYHSALSSEHGVAVIIGAIKVEQLKENLEINDAGLLPDKVAQTIEGVWPTVKEIAPWVWPTPTATMPSSMYGGDASEFGVLV
jgi:hypothetical protein